MPLVSNSPLTHLYEAPELATNDKTSGPTLSVQGVVLPLLKYQLKSVLYTFA